ncbi:hypothetical protein EJB05_03279, partial [Eragrostis curvula]
MGHDANKKKQRRSSRSRAAVAPAAAVSTVLDNDDLLGEVLLRLALPTSLVRAALVCRRWLRVAADPAFLLRFHDRHPSRLLGLYVHTYPKLGIPKFAPAPGLPPELAASARRFGSALDAYASETSTASVLYGPLDGHLLVRLGKPDSHRDLVLSPMRRPGRGPVVVPPPPFSASLYDRPKAWLKLRDDDVPSRRRGVVVCASWRHRGDQTISMYELRGGAWRELISSSAPKTKLPVLVSNQPYLIVPCGDKIHLVANASAIAELRSTSAPSSNVSFVALPDGVKYKYRLEHIAKPGRWRIHSVCARFLLAAARAVTTFFSGWDRGLSKTTDVGIEAVGPCRSAMRVLLRVGADVFNISIKNRTAEKVYTLTPEDGDFVILAPVDMIFPPFFPVIKDDSYQN